MAQINITLNQNEILQLMSNDREGAFKRLLQESLNSFMKAESTEQLKAEPLKCYTKVVTEVANKIY